MLAYRADGTEVDTVVVDGRVLLEGRRPPEMGPGEEAELLARARAASEGIAGEARLAGYRDRPGGRCGVCAGNFAYQKLLSRSGRPVLA